VCIFSTVRRSRLRSITSFLASPCFSGNGCQLECKAVCVCANYVHREWRFIVPHILAIIICARVQILSTLSVLEWLVIIWLRPALCTTVIHSFKHNTYAQCFVRTNIIKTKQNWCDKALSHCASVYKHVHFWYENNSVIDEHIYKCVRTIATHMILNRR
jgi:hypothetical protein